MAKRREKKRLGRTRAPGVPGGHYQRGLIHFQSENYPAAVKAWRVAMKAKPRGGGMQPPESELARKLAEAHFRYALSLNRERQMTQIISELHQAIQHVPDVAIYHYHLGLAYHCKGRYERAITAYDRALKLRPGDARFERHLEFARAESGQDTQGPQGKILQLLEQERYTEARNMLKEHPLGEVHGPFEGYACAMGGDYAEAKKQFNRCATSAYAPLTSYYLGMIYAQESKFPSAIKHLEVAMNEPNLEHVCQPILLNVYKQQAVKYTKAGEQDKANRLWNKIARLDPQNAAADNAVSVALEDGYRKALGGNLTQAMRSWRRLINQGIQSPALLQNYAIACDRTENYENAMETWEQLATVWEQQQPSAPDRETLKRKLALVYRRIGELAWHLDDFYSIREAYQKAANYAPEDLEIRLRLVSLLLDEEDFDTLFRQLRQLRRQHPDSTRVLEIMLTAHLELGEYSNALQTGLDLLKLDPKHQNAIAFLRNLGCDHVKTLCQNNQHSQAISLLRKFLQVDGTYSPFYILLGGALLEKGKDGQAEEILEECITLAEDKALAHAQVGKVYMSAAYVEHATLHFEEAERLDAEHPGVLLTIGTAHMLRDEPQADRYLDKLIASQPEDSEVFEQIAKELIQEDRPDLAQKILDFGLKAFPESIPLLKEKITVAIMMRDVNLMRQIAGKLHKLAVENDDFETLEAISALEMLLTFQNALGGFFDEEYDEEYDEYYDEPF